MDDVFVTEIKFAHEKPVFLKQNGQNQVYVYSDQFFQQMYVCFREFRNRNGVKLLVQGSEITLNESVFQKMINILPILVEIVHGEDSLSEEIKFSLLEEEGSLVRPYLSASKVNDVTHYNIGVDNYEWDRTFGGLKRILTAKCISFTEEEFVLVKRVLGGIQQNINERNIHNPPDIKTARVVISEFDLKESELYSFVSDSDESDVSDIFEPKKRKTELIREPCFCYRV